MMPPDSSSRPRLDFGARIDAIDAALAGLAGGDADADTTLRSLAHATVDNASTAKLRNIRAAAERLEFANSDQLLPVAQELMSRLREAAAAQRPEPAILVIGGDTAVYAELSAALADTGRQLVYAPTGAEARNQLKGRPIICVILNVVLPDLDGRTLLTRLREQPDTASVPVLLLGERLDEALKEESRLQPADGFLEKPRDAAAIAQWVQSRLRRATNSVKSARRDPLTGLLNRAAFREHFMRFQSECAEANEPLALSILSVDNTRSGLSRLDEQPREEALQNFGLTLIKSLRATDVVARAGMYEFAALFPGEDQEGARRAIEKVIERNCASSRAPQAGDATPLVLASGVTLVTPTMSMDDAIAQADQFVYQASALGGNKVVSDRSQASVARQSRVLLLIRDQVTTGVLQQLLEKNNFHVTRLAQWNESAADDVIRKRYHLVVIDGQFPPAGGHEVVLTLRRDLRNSRLPIIMLVAGNAEMDVSLALTYGANDYLVRPFSPLAFVSRVHRLLSRSVSRDSDACRLLFVSDDVTSLVLVATALHQCGEFEVLLARGAEEGIERLQAEAPDVILVDTPIGPAGARPFWSVLAEKVGQNPVSVLVADRPTAATADSGKYPVAICGCVSKPFSPLKVAGEIETLLGLTQLRRPITKESQQNLNDEIHRVTRKAPPQPN